MPSSISQSPLWEIQRDYYQSLGVGAWDDQIPYYLTNSQAMAEVYAEMIVALLRDLGLEKPLPVLELGAGTGRLAYHLVRAVKRKLQHFPHLAGIDYVASDFVEATVQQMENHQSLRREAVDYCLWTETGPLIRRRSGKKFEPDGPWLIVANYFFDSLTFDEFRFSGGRAEECLVEVIPRAERLYSEGERLDIRDVDIVRSYALVGRDRYPDGVAARILEHYRVLVEGGAVTIPVGAIAVLERLMSMGTPTILTSDRGFTDPKILAFYQSHPISLHAGCFSHMVNFHALSLLFRRNWMTQRKLTDGVQTVLLSDVAKPTPELDYVFSERVAKWDLPNQCSELFPVFRDKPNFKSLVAFVRINLADPNAFSGVAKKLLEFLPTLNPDEIQELLSLMEQVWEQDFHFKGGPNLTFWLGQIFNTLGMFERGLFFLDETAKRQGDDAMLFYLRGSALHSLNRFRQAAAMYEKCIAMDGDFLAARQALLSLPKTT